MGFESTPDPVTGDGEDGENQEVSDFQGVADIQNGNAIVNMEEGFTDEIASFSSNGSDIPVESGFQSQASVEELQELSLIHILQKGDTYNEKYYKRKSD